MQHILALIEPLAESGTHRLGIRVCSTDNDAITGLGGETWEPAISDPPKVAFRLFGGEFGATGSGATATRFSVAMQMVRKRWPEADKADWSGAKITIYRGKAGDGWPWPVQMVARVSSYGIEANTLTLNAAVDTEPFEQEFPTATYAGTDEAEGPADLTGRVKPLIIGHARNVEPVLIDPVDNVYQFSAYGPIEAVEALFERGSDFGPSQGDYASYAALLAATVPEGSWATCLAQGMIRLGAPAFGTITANVRGHEIAGSTPRLPGAIISALAAIAGVDDCMIDAASLAAMDAAAPYECALVLTQTTTLRALAEKIAADVNHVSGVGLNGRLFAEPVAITAPKITLHLKGEALPLVSAAQEVSTSPPYSKIELGAARNWRVQTLNELAFAYRSLGPYSATRVYRVDDVATGTDGRAFVYINATPAAGQALPGAGETSNAHWQLFGAADVTAQAQVSFVLPQPFNIQANTAGVTTTDLSAVTRSISVYVGGVKQTSGVTVGTVTGSPSSAIAGSASVTSGVVTVTLSQADAAGSVTMPVIFGGITYNQTITVNRTVSTGVSGGGSGGSSFTDTIWEPVLSTTPTRVTDTDAIVQSNASGELQFSFSASYDGDTAIVGRAQYSLDNSSWTDAGSGDTTGSAPIQTPGEEESGFLMQSPFTVTGLTPSTDYYVRLRCWRQSGSGSIGFGLPNFTVSQ